MLYWGELPNVKGNTDGEETTQGKVADCNKILQQKDGGSFIGVKLIARIVSFVIAFSWVMRVVTLINKCIS